MDSVPQLQVKNTFIEFNLRTPSQTRAISCPPLRRGGAQPTAVVECHAKCSLKDMNEVMSHASTADSDDGMLRCRVETESLVERSPSSGSADRSASMYDVVDPIAGTMWDYCVQGTPSHASLQPWPSADFYASPCASPTGGHLREPVTTTMLRNIPQRFDRELLLDNLIQHGFGGLFDFVYMPNDFSTGVNLGYAFINFVAEEVYMRFKMMYDGVKLAEESPKVCVVCDAKVQGKNPNVEFYRNSTVMNMDPKYHPVVFENGVRQAFPQPTRPLGPVIWKSGSPKNATRGNSWGGQQYGGSYHHGSRGNTRRREVRSPLSWS